MRITHDYSNRFVCDTLRLLRVKTYCKTFVKTIFSFIGCIVRYFTGIVGLQINKRGIMESIGDLIHKEKEAKRKQLDNRPLPVEQLDNSTIGEGSTTDANSQPYNSTEVTAQQNNNRVNLSSNKQLIDSAVIDEYLTGLIMDDIIEPEFVAWYAKCCFTLGVKVVNRLAIASRSGRDPKRLFAFKLKAALQLHFKRQYEREP